MYPTPDRFVYCLTEQETSGSRLGNRDRAKRSGVGCSSAQAARMHSLSDRLLLIGAYNMACRTCRCSVFLHAAIFMDPSSLTILSMSMFVAKPIRRRLLAQFSSASLRWPLPSLDFAGIHFTLSGSSALVSRLIQRRQSTPQNHLQCYARWSTTCMWETEKTCMWNTSNDAHTRSSSTC